MELVNPIPLSLEELVPSPDLFLHESYIHGQLHVARVMVHAFALLELTDSAKYAAPLWAAVYLHDLARVHDGVCHRHGANAVRRLNDLPQVVALFRRGGLRPEDDPAVATAVAQHAIPKELPADHPHHPLTALLKDADGLDRVRLGDLDPQYLRHEVSRSLIRFAQALHDETQYTLDPAPDLFPRLWQIAQSL